MGNFIKYFLNQLRKPEKTENTLDDIKKIFKHYGGGSIDLTMSDDGIGILVLNNPEKRNAMSGN